MDKKTEKLGNEGGRDDMQKERWKTTRLPKGLLLLLMK